MTDFHTLQRDYEFALAALNEKTSDARLETARNMLKRFNLRRHTLSIDLAGTLLVDGDRWWARGLYRRDCPLREVLIEIESAFEEGVLPRRYNPCTLCHKGEPL